MNQTAKIIPFNDAEEVTQFEYMGFRDLRAVRAAYRYCRAIAKSHYENFPVASLIIPGRLRQALDAVYAFARIADDFADEREYEGDRLKKLDEWSRYLVDRSLPTHPVFMALKDTLSRHNITDQPFKDLITAFKMDVQKKRYADFDEVLHYCRFSANPVGRIVLGLFGQDQGAYLAWSDAVCTALQLTNFWQDLAIDLKKNRVYLPLNEFQIFDVDLDDVFRHRCDEKFKMMMAFQIERTGEFFKKGKPLGAALKGRLGVEIRLTWLSGMTVLKKIAAAEGDVFNKRPQLTKRDFAKLFFVALSRRRYERFK
ncbi:MAG: squalene synthase HpnC [Deltaproteobacteria bacterium]|nr:squalene synthase HpnC [Deltaproteobacteria bacterium]